MPISTFESIGSVIMPLTATAPAKTTRVVPVMDEDDSLDWDCYLDKLPPPIAQGMIAVELSPRETGAQSI